MKLSDLKLNSTAIESGEWVDAPGLHGLRFKVRGLGNADYRRLQGKLNDSVPRAKRLNGRVEPAEADRITATLLAQTVLLDWSGLTDDDDATLPFSAEKAEQLLVDPDFRLLRDSVFAAASTVGEMKAEDAAAAAKN